MPEEERELAVHRSTYPRVEELEGESQLRHDAGRASGLDVGYARRGIVGDDEPLRRGCGGVGITGY